jgi:hypothetical protein
VAFVTYVHEVHAQFAKEAMACQSLDNDEILNVRWSTEDPNPVQKVAEKRRLEEMGQEAIRSRMDPKIVNAMRAVRALEDGDVLVDGDDGLVVESVDADGDTTKPATKRHKIEIENAQAPTPVQLPEEPLKPMELLSADALEGLRYFAEIRKRNAIPPTAPPKVTPLPALGLAEYTSDEE